MKRLVLLLAAACGPAPEGAVDLSGPVLYAATAADDYSAGGLAALTADGEVVDLTSLHGDAVVQVEDGVLYALNRLGMDTVRRYDDPTAPPTWEVGVGRGSNPQALARVGGVLVLSRYEESSLLLIREEDGAEVGTVDLEADADGLPEAAGVAAEGDRALVALQRLRRDQGWEPEPEGEVAVVDPAAGSVVARYPVGPDPVLVPHPAGGALVAAGDGLWRVHADGVEGPVVPAGLAGTVGALAVDEDGRVALVVRDCPTCAEHAVVCLDAWDGVVTGTSPKRPVFFSDVAFLDGTAWVAARRSWADPEGAPGGFVAVTEGCGLEEAIVGGTFAPYDLAGG